MRETERVVALAYEGLCTFEFGIVVELFGLPRPEFDRWYEFRVAGVDKGPLRAAGGLTFSAPYSLRQVDWAGTIVIPGWPLETRVPDVLVRKLRRAHEEGARIFSICSGAFVLGACGLLDGRRATTHWRHAAELSRRFPHVDADASVLYVDDDRVITSAGSAAGIDAGLYIIRQDFGSSVANEVARRLVVQPHRDGGQQQFIAQPVPREPDGDGLARLMDSVRSEPHKPFRIADLATRVNMTPRTFARRFKATTGLTPLRWLQGERVRMAQDILETTSLPIERIADRCGFSDSQLLRFHFKRLVGVAPTQYRSGFR